MLLLPSLQAALYKPIVIATVYPEVYPSDMPPLFVSRSLSAHCCAGLVFVESLFLGTPSRAPHRTHPACAKRATYSDHPPVVPHPESIAAQAAYTEAPSGGVILKRRCTYRPSVIYLIDNKLLSLSLALSLSLSFLL